MNKRTVLLVTTLAFSTLMPAFAGGSEAQAQARPGAINPDATNDSAILFMDRGSMANLAEITTSQLALQKSQNADVRAYAQRMITDHTKAQNDLKARAAKKNVAIADKPGSDQRLMYNKLTTLAGNAFDMEYLKVQVMGHESTLALVDTYLSIGKDADALAYAKATRPVVAAHLQMAQQMMQAMMNAQGASGQQSQ